MPVGTCWLALTRRRSRERCGGGGVANVCGGSATTATLTLEQVSGNWTITTVDLQLTGRVPGIDAKKFEDIAADAKANCPVSRVLNAKISLDARLES